jgi:hypothetical protein
MYQFAHFRRICVPNLFPSRRFTVPRGCLSVVFPEAKPAFRYLSNCHLEKSAAAKVSQLFQKGFAGASPQQPLWNIENFENPSQIVAKRRRTSESFAIENTSRDRDSVSV